MLVVVDPLNVVHVPLEVAEAVLGDDDLAGVEVVVDPVEQLANAERSNAKPRRARSN